MRAPTPIEKVGMTLVGMAIGRGLVWALERADRVRKGARVHRHGPTVGDVRIVMGSVRPEDVGLVSAEIENHLRWLRATNGKLGLN